MENNNRIQLQTSGEHLNLASLLKQSDVLLKDVVVSHRLIVSGGCWEGIAEGMSLYQTSVRGFLHLRCLGAKIDEDQFGRGTIPEASAVRRECRRLLDRLGLGDLVGRRAEQGEAEKVKQTPPKLVYDLKWEICVPEYRSIGGDFFLDVDRPLDDEDLTSRVYNPIKTAVMDRRRLVISNQLLKEVFKPLIECLHADWDKLLEW